MIPKTHDIVLTSTRSEGRTGVLETVKGIVYGNRGVTKGNRLKDRRYKAHPVKPLSCFICGKERFTDSDTLQHHMNEEHPGWAEDIIRKMGLVSHN